MRDAADWAERLETEGEDAYRACPRGDWLLAAIADRAPRAKLVAAAVACAELVADLLPEEETRPAAARAAARAFAEGRGGPANRVLAAADAAVHEVVDPASAAAAQASWAALRAVEAPAEAHLAAAAAVRALVLDVGECGVTSARGYAEHTTAERVRAAIPFAVLTRR